MAAYASPTRGEVSEPADRPIQSNASCSDPALWLLSHLVGFVLLVQRSHALAAVRHLVPALVAVGIASTRRRRTATARTSFHGTSDRRRRTGRGRTRRRIAHDRAPATRPAIV